MSLYREIYNLENRLWDLAAFDESKHERHPAGSGNGGQFAPKRSVGKGRHGEAFTDGTHVEKTWTKNESTSYRSLAGVKGIASGEDRNGKIVTPFFKNIVSTDTVPPERRKSMAPIIQKAMPDIINGITAMSDAGIDYGDVLQVGFDDKRNASIFDFSEATKSRDALSNNLDRLGSYLDTFGLGRHASAARMASSMLAYVKEPSELDTDSDEAVGASRIRQSLDGRPVARIYYSFNARTIPSVAQSGHLGGVNIIMSDKPLSGDFMQQWEIMPLIHRTDGK